MSIFPRGAVGVYRPIRSPFLSKDPPISIRPEAFLSRLCRALVDPVPRAAPSIETLVLACPFPEGSLGWNLARFTCLFSGLSHVSGVVLSSLSNSGLEAVLDGAGRVLSQGSACIVMGADFSGEVPYGGLFPDRVLSHPFLSRQEFWPKHLSAHLLAERFKITKEALDTFSAKRLSGRMWIHSALGQKQKTATAPTPGKKVSSFIGVPPLISEDGSAPRFSLAHVAPLASGASALLLSKEGNFPTRPLAYIRAVASAACPGRIAPEALFLAVQKVLRRIKLRVQEIDRFFLDESFAAVPIAFSQHFGVAIEKVNSRAGCLGCGFVLGAEGIRLVGELALSLANGEGKWGIVATWSEGGTATALLLEVA